MSNGENYREISLQRQKKKKIALRFAEIRHFFGMGDRLLLELLTSFS